MAAGIRVRGRVAFRRHIELAYPRRHVPGIFRFTPKTPVSAQPVIFQCVITPALTVPRMAIQRRVLLVEDDNDTRVMTRVLFELEGHIVEEAASVIGDTHKAVGRKRPIRHY